MEKLFRKNPMDNKASGMVNYETLQGMTVESRVNMWMNNAPLGQAFGGLYNTIQTKLKDDIMYIPYEQLTSQPEEVMRDIYKYLDIPYYKQDYNNVKQVTHENDEGILTNHIIRPKIEPVVQDPIEILGLDSCLYIQQNLNWFFDYFGYQKLERGEE
jgi:sulfotransferase